MEISIRQKALKTYGKSFPSEQVIAAFLEYKFKLDNNVKWTRPEYERIKTYLLTKAKWKNEQDVIDKVLPCFTMWDMIDAHTGKNKCRSKPKKIIKVRRIRSIPVFEVEWELVDGINDLEGTLTTQEEQKLFTLCFADIVKMYYNELDRTQKEAKNQKKRKAKRDTKTKNAKQPKIDHFFVRHKLSLWHFV